MMDETLLAIFTFLAYAWAKRRQAAMAEAAKWEEELPINGTDFQGSLWQRLSGMDLVNMRPQDRNLDGAINADPGKVGQANIGLSPMWNGNL